MITGDIKSQIDGIWNAFWSGGISNPLEVIEQITYLLFLRRLDDLHTLEENKAARLKKPIERRIFPKGKDEIGRGGGRAYEDFRWSRFKNLAPAEMYALIGEHVFPFLRTVWKNPDIRYRDSLAQDHAGEEEKYTLVLANPPFAGSLDYENTAKDLLQIVKTKKTELLFLALFLRLLKPGGRAAVIVPDGVLFGSSTAHKVLRKTLVEEQKLDAVVKLPGGVFKPYAGVSTAILLFTKTNSGGTDHVWFYDVQADGWSLDDKRTPLLAEDKLGAVPKTALSAEEHAKNNLPDALARWRSLSSPLPPGEGPGVREVDRPRTAQSFCVLKADIAAQGYDLSLNRYREVVHEDVGHRPPKEIFSELARLEEEIQRELEGMFAEIDRCRLLRLVLWFSRFRHCRTALFAGLRAATATPTS